MTELPQVNNQYPVVVMHVNLCQFNIIMLILIYIYDMLLLITVCEG